MARNGSRNGKAKVPATAKEPELPPPGNLLLPLAGRDLIDGYLSRAPYVQVHDLRVALRALEPTGDGALLLPVPVGQALVNYLQMCPHGDVADLIGVLLELPVEGAPEPPPRPKREPASR